MWNNTGLVLAKSKRNNKTPNFSAFSQFCFPIFALDTSLSGSSAHRNDRGRGSGCRGRGWGLSTGPQTISKHERHRTIEFLIRRLLLPLSGAESGVRATEPLSLDPPAGSIWSGFTCEDQSAVMTSSPSDIVLYLFIF